MLTSANLLAIIVALFNCYLVVKLINLGFFRLKHIPEGDDMAKDLLLKRRAMANGENVYAEGNDRTLWLKQAKEYLKRFEK